MAQSLWKCFRGKLFDELQLFVQDLEWTPPERIVAISITTTPEGKLWVLLSNNQLLCYHNNSSGEQAKTFYSLEQQYHVSVNGCIWWQNRLWLYGDSVSIFQAGEVQDLKALPNDRVHSIFTDAHNRLVVCFAEAGIWYSHDAEEWHKITAPEGEKRLFACSSDREGDLWAVFQNDTPSVSGKRIRHFTAFYHDRGWTNAQMSIWQYKRTQTTWQRIDYLPKAATVMDIVVDDYANCWIGSEYSGIWQCINGKWKQVTNNKNQMGGLRFNGPFKLYRDNQGRIWSIHLLDGLSLYEAGKWYSVMIDTQQEGESHSYWRRETANSAYFDPDHQRIWFTTHSAEIGWIDLDQEISVTPQHIQEYYASLMIPKS